MYSLGMDTIAGAKLLQMKFGSFGAFQPGQAVMHEDRRARFVRASDGAAIIRHWGASHSVAVPPETLSLPPAKQGHPAPGAPSGADARQSVATANRLRLRVRAELRRSPRNHHRRPLLRP
jgi:hypothetical protein